MIILMLLILLFPLQGCYSQNQSQITDQAEITDQNLWDFGQAKEGVILKHDFVLRNESGNILNIKDVNTSCGCTVSKVAKKVLLPDESTLIEVQFNTKGYSGPTQQYIYVHTDNLDKPILRLIIKADVVK